MKRCVIAGGSCSGKSSMIYELKKRGYCCIEEAARPIIKTRNHKEIDLDELIIRQELIFEKQLESENNLKDKKGIYFFDRSLIDNIAFSKYLIGKLPYKIDKTDLEGRYNLVFIPDLLNFIEDGTRIEENEKEREKIHNLILDTYYEYEYKPIKVPVRPIEERVDFILNHINELKGGVK